MPTATATDYNTLLRQFIDDHKIKGKRGEVQIVNMKNELIKPVKATIYGPLAVEGDQIHHIPTGGRVAYCASHKEARDLLFLLLALGDWQDVTQEILKDMPNYQLIGDVIRLWRWPNHRFEDLNSRSQPKLREILDLHNLSKMN